MTANHYSWYPTSHISSPFFDCNFYGYSLLLKILEYLGVSE
nr:MAG TPA: hypothetical protein [Caudoviricetes sp.]